MEDDIFNEQIDEEKVARIKESFDANKAGDNDQSARAQALKAIDDEVAKVTNRKQFSRSLKTVLSHYGSTTFFVAAVLLYSMIGGVMFTELESENDRQLCKLARSRYKSALSEGVSSLNNIRTDFTMISEERKEAFRNALDTLREAFANSTWTGEDCDTTVSNWNVFGATVWCVTVITSVGYGHITPITSWGRIVTIVYALFGIPLTLVMLAKLGSFFAEIAQFSYHVMCCCSACRRDHRILDDNDKQHILRNFFKDKFPNFYFPALSAAVMAPANDPQRMAFYELFGESGKSSSEETIEDEDLDLMALDKLNTVPWPVSVAIIFVTVFAGGSMFAALENWDQVNAIYFSFVTLATIGFGDIYPSLADPLTTNTRLRLTAWGLYIFFALTVMSMSLNMIQLDVGQKISWLVAKCTKNSKKKPAYQDDVNGDVTSDSDNGIYNEAEELLFANFNNRPPSVPLSSYNMLNEFGEPMPFMMMNGGFDDDNYEQQPFMTPPPDEEMMTMANNDDDPNLITNDPDGDDGNSLNSDIQREELEQPSNEPDVQHNDETDAYNQEEPDDSENNRQQIDDKNDSDGE